MNAPDILPLLRDLYSRRRRGPPGLAGVWRAA
jgi:hypothetical protein